MPEIAFENVNLYYGKGKKREDPVKGLSLVLPDGGINVILGPSGSGKTTILRSLVDACEHEGTIKLDGKDIRGIALEKRNVRYVSQTITLYPHMTVFENIAFPLLSAHLPREEVLKRSRAAAKRMGISICLNERPRYLSRGQQQRAMLARELVGKPSLLLLDEPFSSLDPELRKEMDQLVKSLKEDGMTMLFVTHLFHEAVNLADRLYILEGGKIISSGAPRRLLDQKDPYLEAMIESETVDERSLR